MEVVFADCVLRRVEGELSVGGRQDVCCTACQMSAFSHAHFFILTLLLRHFVGFFFSQRKKSVQSAFLAFYLLVFTNDKIKVVFKLPNLTKIGNKNRVRLSRTFQDVLLFPQLLD